MPLMDVDSWGWFVRVQRDPDLWWSARHGCFARLHEGQADVDIGRHEAQELAWGTLSRGTRWLATRYDPGPTWFELAEHGQPPAPLIAEVVKVVQQVDIAPRLSQIRVGFDGRVWIDRPPPPPEPLPPRGYPDTPMRDAYHDARDAQRARWAGGRASLVAAIGLGKAEPGFDPGGVARACFPERAAAHDALRERAELIDEPRAPPGLRHDLVGGWVPEPERQPVPVSGLWPDDEATINDAHPARGAEPSRPRMPPTPPPLPPDEPRLVVTAQAGFVPWPEYFRLHDEAIDARFGAGAAEQVKAVAVNVKNCEHATLRLFTIGNAAWVEAKIEWDCVDPPPDPIFARVPEGFAHLDGGEAFRAILWSALAPLSEVEERGVRRRCWWYPPEE